MIDLYAAPTSNGMRGRIALEECGLEYTLHPINLQKGEHKTPEYLAMNPNGQIPVMVDRDGPGGKPLTLSQSGAILMYCAEKSGRFLPRDPATRAATWQAMMSAATDITPGFGTVFGLSSAKETHAPSIELFKGRLRNYLQVWDDTLAKRKYCAGDEVTVADLSLYAAYARLTGALPDVVAGLGNLARWGAEMGARPAIQRALKF